MRYLLDSTLLIDHGNDDNAAKQLLRRLVEEGHELFTCDVVTCESLSGGDDKQVRHLRTLLDALEYVSTTPEAARRAGRARRDRHRAGGKLGLGDALVAAVAADLDAIVVTRNRPDFQRQGVRVLDY